MRSLILSQCRDLRMGVTREDLGALTTVRARQHGPYGVLPPQIFTHPTTLKLYFQSDFERRAASTWALSHISSLPCFTMV